MGKKYLIGFIFLFALGCAAPPVERQAITVKGSDTMVLLGQRWAEVYMKAHPDVTIQVTGGGSGTGIAALINGTTQICEASRPMKPDEKNSVKEQRHTDAVETPVALAALAVCLNNSYPLSRQLFWYTAGAPTGAMKNFVDWVLGPEGQKVVTEVGYYPLKAQGQ